MAVKPELAALLAAKALTEVRAARKLAKGDKGDDAPKPTTEELQAAVSSWLEVNAKKSGEQIKDEVSKWMLIHGESLKGDDADIEVVKAQVDVALLNRMSSEMAEVNRILYS